ncbi:MAG: hypothetical protein ACPGJW_10695 [Paracoccaceae bacterium]
MKATKTILLLISIVLMQLPFALRAAELEEIVLYHYYTADPTKVDLTFATTGDISSIRVQARKTEDAKSIELAGIDFGPLGSATLPIQLVGCIPDPWLKDLLLRITEKPITAENFGSWASTLVIVFSSYHTDYSSLDGRFIQPMIDYEFRGSKLVGLTVHNGKGDFVEIDGPTNTCPEKEIEWALEDKK